MNGIKGMLLHLARVVHRAGLSVDWDVLHHGLANGLKEQMALDVVSNGRSEFSWPSAKERIVPGSPPSTPESKGPTALQLAVFVASNGCILITICMHQITLNTVFLTVHFPNWL